MDLNHLPRMSSCPGPQLPLPTSLFISCSLLLCSSILALFPNWLSLQVQESKACFLLNLTLPENRAYHSQSFSSKKSPNILSHQYRPPSLSPTQVREVDDQGVNSTSCEVGRDCSHGQTRVLLLPAVGLVSKQTEIAMVGD